MFTVNDCLIMQGRNYKLINANFNLASIGICWRFEESNRRRIFIKKNIYNLANTIKTSRSN